MELADTLCEEHQETDLLFQMIDKNVFKNTCLLSNRFAA